MTRTGIVGLILTVLVTLGITAWVFSLIQIEPVFMSSGVSGSSALTSTGNFTAYVYHPTNLLSYVWNGFVTWIGDSLSHVFRNVFRLW